uniref:Histone H2A n=1 Tax=Myotis lucifugus TaxID=59463 RepID=G1Q9L3_MYOLU
MAGSEAGKDSGRVKAKAVSCTQRARLPFPMGHSHRHLKTRTTSHRRVGTTAACTSCNPGVPHCGGAGLAGHGLKDLKGRWVPPCHLQLEIHGDEELDSLVKAAIAGGEVILHIHSSLVGKKSSRNCL